MLYKKINNKLSTKSLLLNFGIIFLLSTAYSQEYRGTVVAIADGDTFTLLTGDKKQIKVRLSVIDTPKRAQPFGTRARQALSDLAFSKKVSVIQEDIDRYGRLVGHVYVGGTHINRKLVQDGMTWAYRQYSKEKSLLQAEHSRQSVACGAYQVLSRCLPGSSGEARKQTTRQRPLSRSRRIRSLPAKLSGTARK